MAVFLAVVAILLVAVVASMAARDWFEFGVPTIIVSLLYPWLTKAPLVWWLTCGSVGVLMTVIFANRERLAPAVASALRWLTSKSSLEEGAIDRRRWK